MQQAPQQVPYQNPYSHLYGGSYYPQFTSPYNAYNDPYRRLQQLEQMQMSNPTTASLQGVQQPSTASTGRLPVIVPVESEEAARKSELDLSGQRQYFISNSSGEIYVRQFDVSTADVIFERYVKQVSAPAQIIEMPVVEESVLQHASIQDVENLQARIADIEEKLDQMEPIKGKTKQVKEVTENV